MKELSPVFVSVYVTLLAQWICLPRRISQAITFEAAKMGFSFAAEKLTLQQQNGLLFLVVTNNCSCKRADLVLWCHMLLLACKTCSSFTVAHAREDFSAAELHNCLHVVAAKNWSFHWKVHIGGCKQIFVVACMHSCMLQWQHFAGSNLELLQRLAVILGHFISLQLILKLWGNLHFRQSHDLFSVREKKRLFIFTVLVLVSN